MAQKDCIEWSRSFDTRGYGHLRIKGKNVRAHRYIWTLKNGPIPEGMHILHHCDNRRCINIDHLFLGTHADNMRDMAEKGRRKGITAGADNGRAKLTQADVQRIREAYLFGARRCDLRQIYGVSKAQIQRIIAGSQWH